MAQRSARNGRTGAYTTSPTQTAQPWEARPHDLDRATHAENEEQKPTHWPEPSPLPWPFGGLLLASRRLRAFKSVASRSIS